jgi:protein-disulfide isomerase
MSTLKPPVGPHDHVQGNPAAAVTLVEYGDYECPYCGSAYVSVKAVQAAMGDDLLFAFRNFPLTQVHPHALAAACAAEAAALQGSFWEMHDMLFENQGALELPDLLAYAQECDLEPRRFAMDLESEAVAERVRADVRSGARSGVNGTPTFFVNGVRYDNSWEPAQLLASLTAVAQAVARR